jgi:dTDP-4-amino-4,6-dideoxygalactose transaminase
MVNWSNSPVNNKASLRFIFLSVLMAQSIFAVAQMPHVPPLSPGAAAGKSDCPLTVDVSEQLLRLPFYTDLSEADQAAVIEAILAFKK